MKALKEAAHIEKEIKNLKNWLLNVLQIHYEVYYLKSLCYKINISLLFNNLKLDQ